MKKLRIYKTGERYFMDGMGLALHNGELLTEYDLQKATPEELKEIKRNPHNDSLLEEIHKRK